VFSQIIINTLLSFGQQDLNTINEMMQKKREERRGIGGRREGRGGEGGIGEGGGGD
jgi:hypothetical protein